MARIAPLALLALLCAGAYLHHRAARRAPDVYAACGKSTTDVERDRCRNQIDFAMSAGQ